MRFPPPATRSVLGKPIRSFKKEDSTRHCQLPGGVGCRLSFGKCQLWAGRWAQPPWETPSPPIRAARRPQPACGVARGAQACVTGAVSPDPRPRRSARRPLPTAERKARQPTPTTGDCAQPRGHPAGKSTHRRLRFSVTRNVGTRRRTRPRPLPPSDAGQPGSCTPRHSLEVGIQAD